MSLRRRIERLEQERASDGPYVCWSNLFARSPAEIVPDDIGGADAWLSLFQRSAVTDPFLPRLAELERLAALAPSLLPPEDDLCPSS
jgi:hypothetical protein